MECSPYDHRERNHTPEEETGCETRRACEHEVRHEDVNERDRDGDQKEPNTFHWDSFAAGSILETVLVSKVAVRW
jgi:hypothetical protein